ncbi:MAG: hypothetical protein CMC35_01805 [Flavobacteriaceae bacterium]|nr:hypothetical protein [Flavobacteriaceae bacterium]|tara:strand:- start:32639 stop:33559 length:921 start_codon:yes stop_codon:yes gene_type:complete
MKKITFLLTLFIASYSWSQAYIPMLEEGNEWNVDVRYEVFDPPPDIPCCYTITFDVVVGELVEVNGTEYYEMVANGQVRCLLREQNKVIYKYEEFSETDNVIFDFNLQVGETFEIPGSGYDFRKSCVAGDAFSTTSYSELTVGSISTEFIAGEDRTVITFEENFGVTGEPFQWIEGIGNITGLDLLDETIDITAEHRLACFTNQGNTTFFNEATSCDNTTLGTVDNTIEAIGVYPNPVTEVSILSLPKAQQVDEILIFDANGSLVRKEKPSADHLKIHAMNYRSGLYFYKIIFEGNTLKAGKLLIK